MSNAVNRGSFLLSRNRTHGGVENEDKSDQRLQKTDEIEVAEASLNRPVIVSKAV